MSYISLSLVLAFTVVHIFSAKNDNQLTNSTEAGCFQREGEL